MRKKTAKDFESEIYIGLKALKGWSHRLMDTAGSRNLRFSQESPFDFLYIGDNINLAVEAKQTHSPAIPFANLKPHQKENLIMFEESGKNNHSFVAVNFVKEIKDKDYVFYVPIQYWVYLEKRLSRKSIPINTLIRFKMPMLHKAKFKVKVAMRGENKGKYREEERVGWGGFLDHITAKEVG